MTGSRANTAATATVDVERIKEIVRLKDLLGLSLEQLSQLVEAETARAEIRRELGDTDDTARRRELLKQAGGSHRHAAGARPEPPEPNFNALEATLIARTRDRVAVRSWLSWTRTCRLSRVFPMIRETL